MFANKLQTWWYLALLAILTQCQLKQDGTDSLFQLMSAGQTGIDFQNTITPNETYNLLDFEYLYNGGGVGVGDFDNNGLPDLVFTGNMVESKIYLNQGDFNFTDITPKSNFDTKEKWCTGLTIIDINYDGFDDIYVCVGGAGKKSNHPNLLFINQRDNTFKEAAAAYGLDDPNESNQAIFFDYDRDGDLDMYLLNGGGFEKSAVTIRPVLKNGSGRNTDKLYQNNFDQDKGHPVFTDVSKEAGITVEGFGLGVGTLDVNEDGWSDIFVSNDYLSRDLLYINNQDGTFTESANQYFRHMSHFSMGNDFGDINNDGEMDILALDMLPESHYRRKMMFGPNQYDRFHKAVQYDYGYQYMRNMLHLGSKDAPFVEIGRYAGIDKTDWSWCPLIADFDNDGLLDIYITNGYGKDITDLDFVKFRKESITPFANPEEVRKTLIKSLDDRPAISVPNYAYQNNGDHTFTKVSTDWGLEKNSLSNGAVYVDLDQDGDLEIVTNNIDQAAFIYKNNLVENNPASSNFIDIKLEGTSENAKGIGAIIDIYYDSVHQKKYVQPVRGFQSSGPSSLHFGLGSASEVDSIVVVWPNGKYSLKTRVIANQAITFDFKEATLELPAIDNSARLLEVCQLINFQHQEPAISNDFRNQPLLQHGFTNQGPAIAVGDVNNDQLDDVFIGGSYGQSASLFIQSDDGTFREQTLASEQYEDLGALFIDIDNDSDIDLYVVSGGSERYKEHEFYQDRIYINDGKGNFEISTAALPKMLTSTTSVSAGDYDQDGDLDLFVGGRVVPGSFPVTPRSYLLENTGGQYVDVTEKACPDLQFPGMVCSAVWTDFNNDQYLDLIVVGEMMPITFFQNEGGKLKKMSQPAGLDHSSGLWNSITSGDFDQDGDMDYVVGNIGQNTSFKVSEEHPLKLHYADFDHNGSIDPIYSVYEEGAYHPVVSLDVLAQQLPEIKRKFLYYKNYAASSTEAILELLDQSEMETLLCENQNSILIENQGGEQFKIRELPAMAQVSPIKGILVEDINLDGLPDMILVGNDYNTEVVSGQFDASQGQVLINEGNFHFSLLKASESGLRTKGDSRSIASLILANGDHLILVSNNNGPLENYRLLTTRQANMETPNSISKK